MSIIARFNRLFNNAAGRMLRETGLALDAYGSVHTRDIAYLEQLSRHRKIMPLFYAQPAIYDSARIEDNSSLVGEVAVGDQVYIGYGVTIRADHYAIRIGNHTRIGDRSVLLCSVNRLPAGVPQSVNIGHNVEIGEGSLLVSCIVDDNAKIGARCNILDGSMVERGAVLEDDTLVPAGRVIPGYQVWGGSPARFIRDLDEELTKRVELEHQAQSKHDDHHDHDDHDHSEHEHHDHHKQKEHHH